MALRMYVAYLTTWATCILAAWLLTARMLTIHVRAKYPLLFAWCLWIAAAYSTTFALNLFGAYRQFWPYLEAIGAISGIAATVEVFRRLCTEIPNIGRFQRYLFHGALGAAFIISVMSSAAVVTRAYTANSYTLKMASAVGLVLAVFLGTNLAFFKVFQQPRSRNLAVHSRCLALYLGIYGACKFAGQFTQIAHGVSILLLACSTVLFVLWSRKLCSAGDTLPPRDGNMGPLNQLDRDVRVLVREIR